MKSLALHIISISIILFLSSNVFSQKHEVWHQIKTPELAQHFGYVWSYINIPDESHTKCKGHEHLNSPTTSTNKQVQELKSTFKASNSNYTIGYSGVGANQNSEITYKIVNESNETIASDSLTIENKEEREWNTADIDLSQYQSQTLTLVITISNQPINSSLFINLFQ